MVSAHMRAAQVDSSLQTGNQNKRQRGSAGPSAHPLHLGKGRQEGMRARQGGLLKSEPERPVTEPSPHLAPAPLTRWESRDHAQDHRVHGRGGEESRSTPQGFRLAWIECPSLGI